MIKDLISKLIDDEEIEYYEFYEAACEIISGQATPSQIAAFITALRIRGESALSIAAFASVMREKARKINIPAGEDVLDTCGTGGDGANTFNISTAAALICAAAGVKVAKHGNRAVSSQCGSADVLEALGVKIDCSVEKSEKSLSEANFCFLFAPMYHEGMKNAASTRREVGIRSIFNLLGPLSNPARATRQLVGIFNPDLANVFADVLATLEVKRAMLVYGSEMLDEISLSSPTSVTELFEDASVKNYIIEPNDFGFSACSSSDIAGGDKETNAAIILDVLKGQAGPKRDIVLMNAGAALYVAGKADTIREGIAAARSIIDSGAVLQTLEKIKQITNAE